MQNNVVDLAASTAVVINEPVKHQKAKWSGGLTESELNRPGGILLAMIIGCANDKGHQLQEMAHNLGVTYGYINQLRNGTRKVRNIHDDFATACARYLGVPRMTVLLAAGRVQPEDLYEQPYQLALELPKAIGFIAKDFDYGPIMPSEIRDLSYESQFFIVKLYEKATGKKLLSGGFQKEQLGSQIEEVQKYIALQDEQMRLSAIRKQQ